MLRAITRMVRTTFSLRCPECSQGAIYQHLFKPWQIQPQKHCPVCGVRYERDSGLWLMPTLLAYILGALFALGVGFYLVGRWQLSFSDIDDRRFVYLPFILMASVLVFVGLIYRNVKAFWIWILWLMGEVYTDDLEDQKNREAPTTNEA